ncbi:MAG: type I DNA topoisomerase [Candidatus Spechtbacteria bacterium]|nr:type I DNA topoisomerase [Candidatus Spechtbacteria bacterium]
MDLVIVESPTKAKTIQKFLSNDYVVKSSFGHVRDLPKNDLGIDTEHDFAPHYVIPIKARPHVKELKQPAEKAKLVILATDQDREGEAIAWHLSQILQLTEENMKRIVFHEITKTAIENALKNPQKIDMNLVDAQQARRVLDRLVGYKLSPFLWKKVARGLSAGRVQSVAVRLIVDREREIEAFKRDEYWTIEALLLSSGATEGQAHKEFAAMLIKKGSETVPKLGIKTKEESEKILQDLDSAAYMVEKVEKKEMRRNPLPPFATSTLQQEAAKRFHMPARMTMSIAQSLYEKGYITYHRTDSLNLSEQSLVQAQQFIEKEFGTNYYSARRFKTRAKGAQEAHEAIRPTSITRTPDAAELEPRQKKIYGLVWRRFLACQMAQARFDATTVDIAAKNYTFRANGSVLKFDGFLKVYPMKFQENELPELTKDEILELLKLVPSQHFTEPPPRYSEATLIKELEKNGIGRPSTYAPTVSTIQERNYVQKNEQRRFAPTEIGIKVNDLLVEHFPQIVDIQFTAMMEESLDTIARGKKEWVPLIREFYQPFDELLQKKYAEVQKEEPVQEKTGKLCPECGKEVIIRFGRFGKFYACSGFPQCRHTEPLEKKIVELGITCPKCTEGSIIQKQTRRKKIFYSCNRYPACDFALWDKPTGEKCQKCNSMLVQKFSKKSEEPQIRCSNKECV